MRPERVSSGSSTGAWENSPLQPNHRPSPGTKASRSAVSSPPARLLLPPGTATRLETMIKRDISPPSLVKRAGLREERRDVPAPPRSLGSNRSPDMSQNLPPDRSARTRTAYEI